MIPGWVLKKMEPQMLWALGSILILIILGPIYVWHIIAPIEWRWLSDMDQIQIGMCLIGWFGGCLFGEWWYGRKE
jgi:hypothetical protein